MRHKIIYLFTFSILFMLLACGGKTDIDFYSVNDVTSMEFSVENTYWNGLNVVIKDQDCLVNIDDETNYFRFNDASTIWIYSEADDFVGIEFKNELIHLERNVCVVMNPYDDFISDPLNSTGYYFDDDLGAYLKENDDVYVEVILNEDHYATQIYFQDKNDSSNSFFVSGINKISFNVQPYNTYSPIEYVLLEYSDLLYMIDGQNATLAVGDWIAIFDYENDIIRFSNGQEIYHRANNNADKKYYITHTDPFLSQTDIMQLYEEFDNSIFQLVENIHSKVESLYDDMQEFE